MARVVNSYWINFIKTGDPNGLTNYGEPLPLWKEYTEQAPARILFTTDEAKMIPAATDPLTRLRMESNMDVHA